MKVNFSIEEISVTDVFNWLSVRPARLNAGLLLGLVVSSGGAVAWEDLRVPLIVAAGLALAGLLAVGLRALFWQRKEHDEIDSANQLDELSEVRKDSEYYSQLTKLGEETYDKWSDGLLADGDVSWQVRSNALDVLLEAECWRIAHLGMEQVSIVVARVTARHYLIRRVAGQLRLTIRRGHKCRTDQDIADSLLRLGDYSELRRLSCFGEPFAIAALAENPFTPGAKAEVDRIAFIFQLMYERFRLMEIAGSSSTAPVSDSVEEE